MKGFFGILNKNILNPSYNYGFWKFGYFEEKYIYKMR